jgi:hypothetical protein
MAIELTSPKSGNGSDSNAADSAKQDRLKQKLAIRERIINNLLNSATRLPPDDENYINISEEDKKGLFDFLYQTLPDQPEPNEGKDDTWLQDVTLSIQKINKVSENGVHFNYRVTYTDKKASPTLLGDSCNVAISDGKATQYTYPSYYLRYLDNPSEIERGLMQQRVKEKIAEHQRSNDINADRSSTNHSSQLDLFDNKYGHNTYVSIAAMKEFISTANKQGYPADKIKVPETIRVLDYQGDKIDKSAYITNGNFDLEKIKTLYKEDKVLKKSLNPTLSQDDIAKLASFDADSGKYEAGHGTRNGLQPKSGLAHWLTADFMQDSPDGRQQLLKCDAYNNLKAVLGQKPANSFTSGAESYSQRRSSIAKGLSATEANNTFSDETYQSYDFNKIASRVTEKGRLTDNSRVMEESTRKCLTEFGKLTETTKLSDDARRFITDLVTDGGDLDKLNSAVDDTYSAKRPGWADKENLRQLNPKTAAAAKRYLETDSGKGLKEILQKSELTIKDIQRCHAAVKDMKHTEANCHVIARFGPLREAKHCTGIDYAAAALKEQINPEKSSVANGKVNSDGSSAERGNPGPGWANTKSPAPDFDPTSSDQKKIDLPSPRINRVA